MCNLFSLKVLAVLLPFLLGLLVSFIVWLLNWYYLEYKYRCFKKMIQTCYVDNLYLDNSSKKYIQDQLRCNEQSLNYLINHEIQYINYTNQIKFIRLAQFTLSFIQVTADIISVFPFRDLNVVDQKILNLENQETTNIVKKIQTRYMQEVNKYVKMKKDFFLDRKERKSLLDEYESSINND
ncbi:hypothetical protein R078138_00836 [Convivina praedatoris]|uniref:Transmembrane protein n=1 Tax=Convivina praedatoris TaxID=2880963 RepID=A0ABN8H8R7_9LACO|nr:hypothetical protein R077815_00394 [Convivina sp. LMG 32447]CAH1853837.1 hypothetical protein LMG032447_00726 [Convivina sp. LMG 32447]CAH1854243.1 hypothetical protein R078138_00836 [Convivina sp. LMG 32447]